ncbi:MAG: hypothetical protein JW959_02290 [Pirellulales bacterium]|nr:hypothetical protein [Pirellulales bacterium]
MSSVERFNRTLGDRYDAFKQYLDKTVSSFATSTDVQRYRNADQLASAGRDILNILVKSDRPPWIQPITEAAEAFSQQKNSAQGERLLKMAVQHYHEVGPIVIADDSSTYDFDKLYERLRDEGKLPELFDKMIDAVSKMVESGEIDSVTVVDALRRLLNILKANRNGSYVAVTRSLDYAKFIRNIGIEFLKRIPGIREAVNAYEKTLEEAEGERQNLEQQLRDDSLHAIIDKTMFARLQQLPKKQPLLLEGTVLTDVAEPQDAAVDELNAGE